MAKRILAFVVCFLSMSSFACPPSLPTDDANFCSSFKSAAPCYCTTAGVPASMCQDMNTIYNRMMIVFGTLRRACEYQHYTSTQNCMDNWNCYRSGGVNSQGQACSATKMPC